MSSRVVDSDGASTARQKHVIHTLNSNRGATSQLNSPSSSSSSSSSAPLKVPAILSPRSLQAQQAATSSTGFTTPNRRPSVLISQSEKFKQNESQFLAKTPVPPSTDSPRNKRQHHHHLTSSSRDHTTTMSDKEELDRFLDSMKPLAGMKPGSSSSDEPLMLGTLGTMDEKTSINSSPRTFPSLPLTLSPPFHASVNAPTSPPQSHSSRVHGRRPSYMQPTQQELTRRSELRETQQAQQQKRQEEKTRSTRRAVGVTNTDLFMSQQAELEQKRFAQLEKEEAERRAARAQFLAKLESNSNQPKRDHPSHSTQSSYASGSQTSRQAASFAPASPPGPSPNTPSITSTLLLQREIAKREEKILQDAQSSPHHLQNHGDTSDSSDESESDESVDEFDEETQKNTLANTRHNPIRHISTNSASTVITSPSSSAANMPSTLTDTAEPDDDHSSDLPDRAVVSSTIALYDPRNAHLLLGHKQKGSSHLTSTLGVGSDDLIAPHHSSSSSGLTGLDFLLESMKFKRAQATKQKKTTQKQIEKTFGRMTQAQIERSIDTLAAKQKIEAKQAERDRERESRNRSAVINSSNTMSSSSSAHPDSSDKSSSSAASKSNKSSFFPSLWRKITGGS